jgi:ATP-dependent RNA circularization protein (DNA/RNA ligase family)
MILKKPLNRKNYGSIPHLSNSKLGIGDHFIEPGQEKILTLKKRDRYDEILVFEKYDGSNIGITKIDNQIYPLTRSGYKASTSPYKQHHIFNDWVYKNVEIFMDMIDNGERITGEWMIQSHGMEYYIKNDPIIFFDYFDSNNNRKTYDDLKIICNKYNLNTVRLLHRGESIQVSDIIDVLNKKTDFMKSKNNPEGMVYRVERNNKVDFLAKWVRSDYKPGELIIGKNNSEFTWNKIIK